MMINTLLEHVPIKLEVPDNGDDEGDAENNSKPKNKIVKMNGKNVVGEEDVSGDDDEEDDEDTEEDDSETDLPEDDDDATLVPISSDEEAELEAQRIRFHELISKKLHLTTGAKNDVLEGGKKTKFTKKLRGRSVSSCASVSSKASIASCSSVSSIGNNKCSKQNEVPKQKQKSNSKIKKTVACRDVEKGVSTESEAEPDDIAATYKRPLRNRVPSTCSVASSLVTPSCQTESCGNIYVYEEQQKLIFNCSFCDIRYSDMMSFAKHLHNAHKLFQEEEDTVSANVARKNPRTLNKQQAENKTQAQDSKLKVMVKTEIDPYPEEICDDSTSAHSMSPIPIDAILESCGNIFILNGKKLFLCCGHCECKYATPDLFEKHLRQQHQLFSGPVREIDVLPKCEIKVEQCEGGRHLKINAATKVIEKQRKASVEAISASPVMVVLPVSQNVDNNDIVPAAVGVQIPDTPPPEEDKVVEESKLNTANKQKMVSEKTVMNEAVHEAENAVEEVDDNQVPLRVEEHAQLETAQQVHVTAKTINENEHKPGETLEDDNTTNNGEEQKPVARRKRKRRSVFSKRSPPKKRGATTKAVNSQQTHKNDESNTDGAIACLPANISVAEQAEVDMSTTLTVDRLLPVIEEPPMETDFTETDVKTLAHIVEDVASAAFTANIEDVSEKNVAITTIEIKKQKSKTEKIKIHPKPAAKRTRKNKNITVEKESDLMLKSGTTSKASSPDFSGKSSLELDLATDATEESSKPVAHTMRTTCYSETHKLRYACNQCPKSFSKSPRLAEHKRLHTGEKPFSCEECGKTFRIKRRLSEHKMRHLKVKAYKCETCGMPVATKQDLRLHQRHHTNDRRYTCTDCSKAFVRSSDLKIHKRVHTGEKPFVCEICQKTFRANQNLLVHRRSHMGEKNYKCDYCDKRFMRNIDRKVHHRTHTGERPFKCEICGRCYSSRAHVRSHIQREHVENGGDSKPVRKKAERKTKTTAAHEIVKEQQLIDEIQEQILQCLKTDDLDDEELPATTTTIVKAAEIKKQTRRKSTPRASPALKNGVDADMPAHLHSHPQGQVHEQSMGAQQVSVTVSMQVQNDVVMADEPMPEKENATAQLVGGVSAPLNKSTKSERKISSYFTVLGQKTEI